MKMLRRLRAFGAMAVSLAWLLLPAVAQETGHVNVRDDFSPGTLSHFDMPFPEDWQILGEGQLHYLHMLRPRTPGVPRRPLQFARLKGVSVGSFALSLKIRREHGSMIIVFGYVDTLHFYYAHLSKDPGTKVSVHNGIFIVDGGERRRIAGVSAQAALPDLSWHDVRIARDVGSGSIQVFVDRQAQPLFSVVDRTFLCGQIGLGSFDETGDFAQLRLNGKSAECHPAATRQ
ncbi:MAG: hypothetical protein WA510_09315 [Acidobacteriaceae bacterium]